MTDDQSEEIFVRRTRGETIGMEPKSHIVSTKPLTTEEARIQLEEFLATPQMAELAKEFEMSPRIVDEEPMTKEGEELRQKYWAEQVRFRKEAALLGVAEAGKVIGNGLEFAPTGQELLAPLREILARAVTEMGRIERYIDVSQGTRPDLSDML